MIMRLSELKNKEQTSCARRLGSGDKVKKKGREKKHTE